MGPVAALALVGFSLVSASALAAQDARLTVRAALVTDVWAPLEGRAIDGGVRLAF